VDYVEAYTEIPTHQTGLMKDEIVYPCGKAIKPLHQGSITLLTCEKQRLFRYVRRRQMLQNARDTAKKWQD